MPPDVVPVFVSSTSLDLGPERRAAEKVVHGLRETKFVGMEYFGSRDETTRRASLDEVDRSELYVGIFAARYGSGITEDEYRRARSRGLPCLIYFKGDGVALSPDQQETDADKSARLAALKQELRAAHTVRQFKSPDDLAAQLATDLHRWLFDSYLTPRLQASLRGELPRDDAQALLDAVKDLRSLEQDLLDSLRDAGFNVASGARSVAYKGDAAQVNINTGDTTVYNVAAPVIPTLHQLRAPVGDFVGREKEIAELLATLRRGASAAITGISGMGGIGKTELSLYVAERLRDAYPDAQLVLDMRGTDDPPRDPSDALASCIRAFLGLEYKTPDNLDDLTHLYRSTLQGKRALILLDNARDSAQARPLLPPAGSALLITSRETIALPGMKRVTLDQLHPDEARELLTGIARRVTPEVADQICCLCGYLPLAIRAAGSLLDVTVDLDPSDYATQLGDERRRLELIGAEGVDVSVEASFKLSYDRLSPDAARVFRQLSVFPATFDAAAEEAVCQDENHKHLTDLLRRNLVLYNPDTRRHRLHDLARLFADSLLDEAERSACHLRHSGHYIGALGKCDELYQQGGEAITNGLALFDAERHNAEEGQRWVCEHYDMDETAARLCNEYPYFGAYVLRLRLHPRKHTLWLEAALAAARHLKDRAAEGRHLGNLGSVYGGLGELRRSIEFLELALAALREVGDRNAEGIVLGNLGIDYSDLGETQRAIEFYERQLAIAREVGSRREEGNALNNLGIAYSNLGEVLRSMDFYEQALVILREISDRRGEGSVLGNLGSAYGDSGEPRRAIEFYKQALVIHQAIGNHLSEGIVLFNIGLVLDKLNQRAEAIARVEAALEIFEQIESPNVEIVRAALARLRGEATGGE